METVIFANGPCASYEKALQVIPRCTLSIAADGGLYHCRNCDLVPDILIGDFDSIPVEMLEDYRRRQCTVFEFPVDKDATDLELAVNTAIERGSSAIHLFGVLGGRWDMSLANILLLSHEKYKKQKIIIYDTDTAIQIFHPGKYRFVERKDRRISFLPVSARVSGVSLTGFKYPLGDQQCDQFGAGDR